MKRSLSLMLLASMLIVASCKKIINTPEPSNSVTINGQVYSTVKIGTQTWTTVNYNGNGGINYNDGANDASAGKFYSYTEVKAITNLPSGWRIPTETDVKMLMDVVGSKTDANEIYVDASASKKLMSTTGWADNNMKGDNSTGLNLAPTGYFFANSAILKNFYDKGVIATFWTGTTVSTPSGTLNGVTYYDHLPLYFEISTESYDSNDQQVGLRGQLYNTTANGDGVTKFPAEKRAIRFVKDN